MKSIIFWNMTPCSLLSFNRRFGGAYRLHLQGGSTNLMKSHSAILKLLHASKRGDKLAETSSYILQLSVHNAPNM
jgi:hypothetical protein